VLTQNLPLFGQDSKFKAVLSIITGSAKAKRLYKIRSFIKYSIFLPKNNAFNCN